MNFSSVQDLKKQQQPQRNGKWNSSGVGESSSLPSKLSYYVKLAPESPSNKSLDVCHDESSYDSFHNWETDVCKDSEDDDFSDSGSSKTEGYAVLDVEYEVASTSDDDETSSSVSSGTDEFAIEAATNAFFEFNALVNGQLHDEDDDDNEFILADTEDDSDGSVDLELGQADYWKCVKCNNKQNNPLYRYCEKCYQVRKSLFPPRPKRQRKSRTENNRKRKMAQQSQDYTTSELDSDSEFESPVRKKLVMSAREESLSPSTNSSCLKNGNQSLSKDNKINCENGKHAANSAGELSCNNSSTEEDEEEEEEEEIADDGETASSVSFQKYDERKSDILTKIKVSPSASIEISKVSSYPSTSLIKLESSREDDNDNNGYIEFKVENKLIQNVYRQELKCSRRLSPPKSLEWKDSGMSSCQDSSQEFSSSPIEEGYLARTSSSTSTQSADSQNYFTASQASTQIQQDSDEEETDSEGILTRVEEFTQERQEKMKQDSNVRPTISDSQMSQVSEDFSADINDSNLGICRFCMVNPKNGVFVHSNCLHLCCCYKCAIKVWKKRKSCPICNCKIKNVTKLFVH